MITKLKELSKDLLLAILAGISISVGCVVFLSVSETSKIVGGLLFTVGLFIIVNFDFNLFTGKVCYALDNKPEYLIRLVVIWLGNAVGAVLVALILRLTRLDSLIPTCQALVGVKMADGYLSLFILGFFCNMLIYLAVHGYKFFKNPVAQTVALFFGVSIFVICGFEHCVADMFYFAFVGNVTGDTILRLLIITLGNIVGGLFIPALMKVAALLTEKKKD